MILVTGGCGFIGSNFIRYWLAHHQEPVVNVDCLTYAGNANNLNDCVKDHRYLFEQCDIVDAEAIDRVIRKHKPRAILHFAAESHVDRSIVNPRQFVDTNVIGTFNLLESCRQFYQSLERRQKTNFRFIHVSTDEVYGSLQAQEPAFNEENPLKPNSPYAASKAASDLLVRSYFHTYQLPVITTNCSNNYGPYQFPEKFIPLLISSALQGKPLPIYGDGQQIRDWLHVHDHCSALNAVLTRGRIGETYNIGGNNEFTNIRVVEQICATLDECVPRTDGISYRDQIAFVRDRDGHDRRYAIDNSKICSELGWQPGMTFENGLLQTITWYLNNRDWLQQVSSGEYRHWLQTHYGSAA